MTLTDRLPFLRGWLAGRDTLRRAIDNSIWLFADQVVRMAAGFVVGIWMARHFGPEGYGWLNYAIATVGIVGAFTTFGLNAIVVRNLVRAPDEAPAWLGTALLIRSVGAAAGFLACLGIARWHGEPARVLVPIVAASLLLQVADVADLSFQARGQARVSAWVRMATCLLGTIIKVILLAAGASLTALAIAGVAEIGLAAIGWWWGARRSGLAMSAWRCERDRAWRLLRESWPVAVSGLAVSTQAFADQLVLGALLGGEEVGQYAAALRIVSVFAFVPMVLQTVAAPEITRAKQADEVLYRRRLHGLYRTMFGLFLLTALPLALLGPMAARWLYGGAYEAAAALLPWMALRLFFTNFGVARSLFLTNEDLLRFGLITAVAGAVVNLALNFMLVPAWGARGAIVASWVSFGVTTFVLELFEPRARANLRLMLCAIALPWRRSIG